MLKVQLEELIEKIKTECNYHDGAWPYASNEEYAAAEAKHELAEEILDLIKRAKENK